MYALLDCNNFYVSCERLFDPSLFNRPVIVLSSDTGCILARSNEAKKLDLFVGQPLHECAAIVRSHQVVTLTANHALYQDISRRVMEMLREYVEGVEVYSIDEAFFLVDAIPHYMQHALTIRKTILHNLGIPVSIGIAATKTLAKLANDHAKKYNETGGVYDLSALTIPERESYLATIPIEDVWGIGRQSARKLYAQRIATAKDLIHTPPLHIKSLLGAPGVITSQELQGEPQHHTHTHQIPLSMSHTRTLSCSLTSQESIEGVLTSFVSELASKLRKSDLVAHDLSIFIQSDRFRKEILQHYGSERTTLVPPTNHTNEFIAQAQRLLRLIYNPHIMYKRLGVTLSGITSAQMQQVDLYSDTDKNDRKSRALRAIDAINHANGVPVLQFAPTLFAPQKLSRQSLRTPRYTTKWTELKKVC